jgi:hypothetical protein
LLDLANHGAIDLLHSLPPGKVEYRRSVPIRTKQKKADVVEHFEMFDHVGLLVNEPPGAAELPFI